MSRLETIASKRSNSGIVEVEHWYFVAVLRVLNEEWLILHLYTSSHCAKREPVVFSDTTAMNVIVTCHVISFFIVSLSHQK